MIMKQITRYVFNRIYSERMGKVIIIKEVVPCVNKTNFKPVRFNACSVKYGIQKNV